jgi:ADP-heptose:LPS heptosyltransferase
MNEEMSHSISQESRQSHTVMVRMDKMGDLVLSLPCDQHPALKERDVHWAITKGLEFVAEQALPKRKYTSFSRNFSPLGFLRFKSWLQSVNPLQIVILHAPWWVSCAAWWAGVPVRIGPLSQWHSYLFLNFGIRQQRSLSDRHESDYNYDLIDQGFGQLGVRGAHQLDALKKTHLKLIAPNPEGTLSSLKLKKNQYIVIHPGMGGSAFNWPVGFYLEAAKDLSRDFQIVITGTQQDRKYLDPIEDALKEIPQLKWLVGELSPLDLLNLLSGARAVVAPSTGVIHLAASLGVPVVGIYSPKKQQHPTRWGPKGPMVRTFIPDAFSDEVRPEVMSEIKTELITQAVRTLP